MREIDYSKPVMIYRNLHKKCWSIQQNGLVVGHSDQVFIKNATFVVRKGGQAKVRATKKKQVHAFVKGTLVAKELVVCNAWQSIANIAGKWCHIVKYNPYQNDTFMQRDRNMQMVPISSSEGVYLTAGGNVFAYD
jgi:hypothetical protein